MCCTLYALKNTRDGTVVVEIESGRRVIARLGLTRYAELLLNYTKMCCW